MPIQYESIWQTLYNNNVDVVLAGHDHIYERFAPQTPMESLILARGIREFIVGSGTERPSLAAIFPNSEVRNVDTYGVLKLTLHPTSYDWQFVPEAGKTFTDTGTGNCHGTTSGTPLPTATNTTTSTPARLHLLRQHLHKLQQAQSDPRRRLRLQRQIHFLQSPALPPHLREPLHPLPWSVILHLL